MKSLLKRRDENVLLIVGIALLALWLLGLGTSYQLGGFIYIALLLGVLLVMVSLVRRFRAPRR